VFFEDLEVGFVFNIECDFYFIAEVAAFFLEAGAEVWIGEDVAGEFFLLV
jgi:hypothetical protein